MECRLSIRNSPMMFSCPETSQCSHTLVPALSVAKRCALNACHNRLGKKVTWLSSYSVWLSSLSSSSFFLGGVPEASCQRALENAVFIQHTAPKRQDVTLVKNALLVPDPRVNDIIHNYVMQQCQLACVFVSCAHMRIMHVRVRMCT